MKNKHTIASILAFTLVGCQSVSPSSSWNPFAATRLQESKYGVPARMAVMWSPAIYNQAGQAPTRGFGGRVYFYDAKNSAIPVEGQLVVFAYNNDQPKPNSKVPDRKYAFTPEQFTQHYTPSELGASYSIWIPWDAAGQPQAEISLVPIFTASSGALVMGQPSRNLLPGPTTPQQTSYVTNCTLPGAEGSGFGTQGSAMRGQETGNRGQGTGDVQQIAYMSAPVAPPPSQQQHVAPGVPQFQQSSGLSTMSITLPGTMADRLAQATPQVSLVQRMAALRQDALAKQSGYAPPTALNTAPHINTAQGTPTSLPTSTAGVPQPWFPGSPPQARSPQPARPALGGPTLPPTAAPLPTPPFPGALPSGLPSPPESAPYVTGPDSSSAATKAGG
jgi:hypothetical protein